MRLWHIACILKARLRARDAGRVDSPLTDSCSDEILLEVDSKNNSAYLLYTSSGFSIRTQYDYYARSINDA